MPQFRFPRHSYAVVKDPECIGYGQIAQVICVDCLLRLVTVKYLDLFFMGLPEVGLLVEEDIDPSLLQPICCDPRTP